MSPVFARRSRMSMARSPSLPTTMGSWMIWSPTRSSAVSATHGSFPRLEAGAGEPPGPGPDTRFGRGSGTGPRSGGGYDEERAAALAEARRHAHGRHCLHPRELALLHHDRAAALGDEAFDTLRCGEQGHAAPPVVDEAARQGAVAEEAGGVRRVGEPGRREGHGARGRA